MSKLLTRLLTPSLITLFVSLVVYSQTSTATLSGTVTDEKDAVVPGAVVKVANTATGFSRTVTTDENGSFVVPLLPPSTYTVTIERTGFALFEARDLTLNVGDSQSMSVRLKVGNVGETVQVNGSDFSVTSIKSDVSTIIPRDFVQNMPLNGRSFASLVLLTPGVTVTSGNAGFGQFSVNGQRPNANYFTVDGVSANSGVGTLFGLSGDLAGAYPAQSAFGSTNSLVSIDALEEFQVQTSTYTAESGRQPGAQVQIVTRSGKNQVSGSLFEYFRNEALDARNFFNFKPQPKPALRQNQFGGTLGGPLPFFNFGEGGPLFRSGKDRTFFFFSYEGQRLQLPSSGVLVVPSLRLRDVAAAGIKPLLDAFPKPSEPELLTSTVCPAPPQPPNPACDTVSNRLWSGVARYNYSISNPRELNATSIRIDHNINAKNSLFGRFNEAPSNSTTGTFVKSVNESVTRTLTFGLVSILSNKLNNELRFNFTRTRGSRDAFFTELGGGVEFDRSLLVLVNDGRGSLNFSGLGTGANVLLPITLGTFSNQPQRQINIIDNVGVALGSHQLKIGIDFRRINSVYGARDQNSLTLSGEAGVRNGTLLAATIAAVRPAEPQYENFSAFVQDTWQASKRLTLDLGLRWEFNPPPTEANGQVPRVVLGIVDTDVTAARLAPEGTPFYKTFYKAFAPRLGAAYQLFREAGWETVVRGGFGVYYDLGSTSAGGGWPITASRSLTGTCLAMPITSACAQPPVFSPATTSSFSLAEDLTLPYTLQWNTAVEQAITKQHSISASYVGSAGRKLLTTLTLNGQRLNPLTGGLTPRPNPNFAGINYSFNRPTSDYHALQAQYKARLSQRLNAIVNYTWSHAIDEVSVDFGVGASSFERGNASFDVRHNMSAAIHFEVPALNYGKVLSTLFKGWSLDTLIHAQTGRPLDILGGGSFTFEETAITVRPDLILGQPLYIKDPTVAGGRRFNTAAFQLPPRSSSNVLLRQGTLGRNVLRELPLFQVDLGIARTIKLREKLSLQLKGEAFNVLNSPMFGNYGLSLSLPATFGVPQSTLNQSLGGMDALYELGGPRSIQLSARVSF